MKRTRIHSTAEMTPNSGAAVGAVQSYPRLASSEADASTPAPFLVERVRELGQAPASSRSTTARTDRWLAPFEQPERWDGLA